MSTAKKTLDAAVATGTVVLTKARELPKRVIDLTKEGPVAIDIRELPKQVQEFGRNLPERATGLLGDVVEFGMKAQKFATDAVTNITKRGAAAKPAAKTTAKAKAKPKAKAAAKPKAETTTTTTEV